MIALTSAMPVEIGLIKESVDNAKIVKWADWNFITGELFGSEVVVTHTGVGKVLAALVTQRLIDVFKPSAVIMSGIAGSIDRDLNRGDLVVGIDCIQHDFDAAFFGFERGHIPYTDYHIIEADSMLVEKALSYDKESLKKGRILTGDQFISDAGNKRFDYLRDELKGSLVDMEGAASALTAMVNEIPFLIIRAVSDYADGEGGKNYKKFIKNASVRILGLIEHILKQQD